MAEGRELFLVGCSFCHGKNGEGILTEDGDRALGPSLVGVGAAAVDFQVGTGRMPMAQPGAQAPRKQALYTDDEIAALAAYVASLGPGPAIPDESDYSLEGLSDEEREEAVVRGGQIFLTNCTACHNFDGSGGAMPRGRLRARRSGASSPASSTRRCSPARRTCRTSPTATCPRRRSVTSSPTSTRSRTRPSTAASAWAASAR